MIIGDFPESRLCPLARADPACIPAADSPLSSAAPLTYAQVVLAKSPVAYWRLGEAQGPRVYDISGHGHDGIIRGAPVFEQLGAIHADVDTAVMLEGARSCIEIPNHRDFSQPTSGKGLTVEAWLRPDALAFPGETEEPYVHWLGKGTHRKQEWALRFYSSEATRRNRISAYLFNPDGGPGAGAFFQDELLEGEWIHVVACFDPGDARSRSAGVHIYKNGLLRRGPPAKGTLYSDPRWRTKPVHGTAPLRLGTQDLKSFLRGGLDEVAIYPRVLTAQEVEEHFKASGRG